MRIGHDMAHIGHNLGRHRPRLGSTWATIWVHTGWDLGPRSAGPPQPRLGSASATTWPTSDTTWVHIGRDSGQIRHNLDAHWPRHGTHRIGHDMAHIAQLTTSWVHMGHDLGPHRLGLGSTSAGPPQPRLGSASATMWPTSDTTWVHISRDLGQIRHN